MNKILIATTILFINVRCFSQKELFEYKLDLDLIKKYGQLWGGEINRWEFNPGSKSFLNDELWGQILPKSIHSNNKIIITKNELGHFLEMDGIKAQARKTPFSNPSHWEGRFGKQIQTIAFDKPLHLLVVKKDKLVKLDLDFIEGLRYPTFYPQGKYDITDKGMVPIIYKQKHFFQGCTPVLFVTSNFLEQLDLSKVRIKMESFCFGTENYPGFLRKIGIDFNCDGQNEVLMYHEEVEDLVTPYGEEGSGYTASIIALYYKNEWYRTSFWQDGPGGLEGF